MANELSKMGHLNVLKMGPVNCVMEVWAYLYFFTWKKKFENMYLPLNKSYWKLFGVKCINLDSPMLRNNSNQEIDTYSLIIKLYKSQHCQKKCLSKNKQNIKNTKEPIPPFENLIKTITRIISTKYQHSKIENRIKNALIDN